MQLVKCNIDQIIKILVSHVDAITSYLDRNGASLKD